MRILQKPSPTIIFHTFGAANCHQINFHHEIILFTCLHSPPAHSLLKGKNTCKKEAKKLKLSISAPVEIQERQTLVFDIPNAPTGYNYDASWTVFPGDEPFQVYNNGFYEKGKWEVSNVSVFDEGDYTFSLYNVACGTTYTANRHVEVVPIPSPCFDDIVEGEFQVFDPATGETNYVQGTTALHFSSETSGFHLHLGMPMFSYSLELRSHYTPKTSCTFYLRNLYENASDDTLYDNNYEQMYVSFAPSNMNQYGYRILPLTEDIYIKREQDHFTLTMCNVPFYTTTGQPKYITTKIVFDL